MNNIIYFQNIISVDVHNKLKKYFKTRFTYKILTDRTCDWGGRQVTHLL